MPREATTAPPRVTLTNLRSGVTVESQFNPTRFQEQVVPNFADQVVLGLSHQPRNYTHTSNHRFTLDFKWKAMSTEEMVALKRARRFLLALAYSSRAALVSGGAPPRILFVWPRMVSMTVQMGPLGITHSRFNHLMESVEFEASVEFTEARDFRITSEEVFEDNQLRFGDVPGLDVGV